MIREIALGILAALLLPLASEAQRSFDVTITLDSSMDQAAVHCVYDDGLNVVPVVAPFVNHTLVLKGQFYSRLLALTVWYEPARSLRYENSFFLANSRARIALYPPNDSGEELPYQGLVNAIPVYDTTSNPISRDLDRFDQPEFSRMTHFLDRHGAEIDRNDSLKKVFRHLVLRLYDKKLEFLKNYPDAYFSFWVFRAQIVRNVMEEFRSDTAYLKHLRDYALSVFPPDILKSVEGKDVLGTLNAFIHPLHIGQPTPPLVMSFLDGRRVPISGYAGKFVLLNFWTSAYTGSEVPFLMKLRRGFPPDRLVMIGVNEDADSSGLGNLARWAGFPWTTCYDDLHQVENALHIYRYAIPAFILIDRKGRIAYGSTSYQDAADAIPKMLTVP